MWVFHCSKTNRMGKKSPYSFDTDDITRIRSDLLNWYKKMKRNLPWRHAAENTNKQHRAYAVWVSEVMLQQTRVATVIDYYNRWMLKWPSVEELANADLNEVNEVWAGLGYYSRARRLHEGAQVIVKTLDGQIPETSKDLMKLIPGVGRYTAAAISSIAYNEKVGVLDGNVIRVLCRMLTIGGDVSSKKVLDHLWKIVDMLILERSPGDFNQALMELGALVCTPKNPQCSKCPVKTLCRAYHEVERHGKENSLTKDKKRRSDSNHNEAVTCKKVKVQENFSIISNDIEDCYSYLQLPVNNPWIPELGVRNYPRKAEKKPPRRDTAIVSVIEREIRSEIHYLITQRPKTGLLAGLWEFPTLLLNEELMSGEFSEIFPVKSKSSTNNCMRFISKHSDPVITKYLHDTKIADRSYQGEYIHVFSHIHLRYIIEYVKVVPTGDKLDIGIKNSDSSFWRWVSKQDFSTSAMSSAMHKILKICNEGVVKNAKKRVKVDENQKTLKSFFSPKAKREKAVKMESL